MNLARSRTERLTLVCVVAWAVFALRYAAMGLRSTVLIDVVVIVALVGLLAAARSLSSLAAGHALLAINVGGLVAAAQLAGQGDAMPLWYLTLCPLVGAYLLDRQGMAIWTVVGVVAIVATWLSGQIAPIEAELQVTSFEQLLGQITLLAVGLGVGLGTRRAYDAKVAELAEERAKLERRTQALELARDEALSAAQAKSAFLASMSHEIRTPLNGVLGMAQLLQNSELPEHQHKLVDSLAASGTSLLTVVNDILDFSKIESGRLELDAAQFDLIEIAEDVVDLFAAEAWRKGIDLAVVAPDQPAKVIGDAGRVRQVLANLVSNAVKFTDAGGVELRVGRVGSDLRCEVRDTGIGIPADAIDTLFDPFVQASVDTAREFGGTGLGLTVCSRLVELMGGRLGVDSEEGIGSTFWFSLPTEHVEQEDTLAAQVQYLLGHRVAVVEPRRLVTRSLVSMLSSWGMEVGAVDKARVVLLSSRVPDPEGMVARFVDTPVLLLAPRMEERWLRRAGEIGAAGVVALPARRRELQNALMSVLHGRRASMDSLTSGQPLAEVHPLRILVAEDNPVNQRVIRLMLDREGYRPEIVADGAEAVDAVRGKDFDLVLMDLRMPVMGGIEAARRIRALADRVHQPAIYAVSASVLKSTREQCVEVGFDGFLDKPIDVEALRILLQQVVADPTFDPDSTPFPPEDKPPSATLIPSAPLEPTGNPVFDALSGLLRLTAGDSAKLSMLIDTWVKNAERLVGDMRDAVRSGDLETASRHAHSLKGSSPMYGADGVAAAAAAAEQNPTPQTVEDVATALLRVTPKIRSAQSRLTG